MWSPGFATVLRGKDESPCSRCIPESFAGELDIEEKIAVWNLVLQLPMCSAI
jgi:hypothetical protein